MPLRHDPLLAARLAREIEERWKGRKVRSLRTDRDARRALLEVGDEALLLLLHPQHGYLLAGRFERLARELPAESARIELHGARIAGVSAPADERLLVLDLEATKQVGARRLVAELHTNQWNLILLRRASGTEEPDDEAGWGKQERVLWRREPGDRVLLQGAAYRPPAGARNWEETSPEPAAWEEMLTAVPPEDRRGHLLRRVAWLSSLNVEWVLGEAARRHGRPALQDAYRRYRELRRQLDGRDAWLLDLERGPQPYVHRLGREDARPAEGLLEAMRISALRSGILAEGTAGTEAEQEEAPPEEDEETARLRDALETKLDRLQRRAGSLERELEEGADPDALRETGNLILARLGEIPRGADSVALEKFEGGTREVELDPSLSPSDNAERYYEEAARRERALEKVPVEIERTRRQIRGVEAALESLEREGPSEDLWEMAGGRPRKEDGKGEPGEKLPYRTYRTSGELEVRVGKGAKSNEELTFHHSHTEDVWLHARQVPGAHVILRWAGREGNPPKRDLQEAAVLAAVHSDARHSGTVGVDWTRRKYVRSPRKSAPGVVIPRNVQTLFVRPDPALEKKLRAG